MVKKITGYHGTVKDNSTLILQNGFKINTYSFSTTARQPIPGDLGAGLYAYQDDIENAKRFAHKFKRDIAIFKLTLEVDEHKYLDMDEKDNAQLILDIYNSQHFKTLKHRYEQMSTHTSQRKCLDGLILEYIIHKNNLRVDLVKKSTYTRFEGMPSISHYPNGIELCIKNKAIIKNTETV